MRFLVINPAKVLYDFDVKGVVLPGADGEFSVLDWHQSFLYKLKPGVVKIIESPAKGKGITRKLNIGHGIAKMVNNTLTLLIEGLRR